MNLIEEIRLEIRAWYMAVRRVARHYPRMALYLERKNEALERDRREDWESQIDRRLSDIQRRDEDA